MLEDLDKINWAELSHARGSAINIPDLIRQLPSSDEKIGFRAYWEFTEDIFPDGTIYEASSYTVPFLIELIEAVEDKYNILSLIRDIASGITPYEVYSSHLHFDEKVSAKHELEKPVQLEWVSKCYAAGREGLEIYYKLVDHSNSQVRDAAIRLIAVFREADTIKTSSKKLYDRFLIEEDRHVKAELIKGLGFISTPNTIESDLIYSLLTPNTQEDYLAPVAAVSLARIFTIAAPELVTTILINTISEPAADIFSTYVDTEDACEGLQLLGEQRAIPALIQALGVAKTGEDIFTVLRFLLDLAFKDYKQKRADGLIWQDENDVYNVEYYLSREAEQLLAENLKAGFPALKESLTIQQRQVLMAIVEQESLWQKVATDFYKVYGLPTALTDLANLIA